MKTLFRAFAILAFALSILTVEACGEAHAAAPAGDFSSVENGRHFTGAVNIDGALDVTNSGNVTTCTLNAASPSACTATVIAGSKCVCSNVGATAAIAAAGCAVGLSGTTLTVTSANAASNVVNIHCL